MKVVLYQVLMSARKSSCYTAEEIQLIRDLRDEYRNTPIEHRKVFFQDAYDFWFHNMHLHHGINEDGRKVCDLLYILMILVNHD
jgi:hypothetical protein